MLPKLKAGEYCSRLDSQQEHVPQDPTIHPTPTRYLRRPMLYVRILCPTLAKYGIDHVYV